MENEKLHNVHEAMQLAVLENQKPEMVTAHFKVDTFVKTMTEEICYKHGVTLSAFVRKCCEILVAEYQGTDPSKSS